MSIIVTGSSGFIATNFILQTFKNHLDTVIPIDKVLHGKLGVDEEGVIPTVKLDLSRNGTPATIRNLINKHDVHTIFHFAADSHVDHSIESPLNFVDNNVYGTVNILEGIRRSKKRPKFVYISTDEVYGDLPLDSSGERDDFIETDAFHPNSPYSASKAAGEMFCHAYGRTWEIPYVITRTCNNYGPYQTLDKFMPKAITNMLQGKTVPVYGKGYNEREWIYVEDNCEAIWCVAQLGILGEAYNIGSDYSMTNISLVETISHVMQPSGFGATNPIITFVKDRPGHDLKYKVESSRIRDLGWTPRTRFSDGLVKTIQWYTDNRGHWWDEEFRNNPIGGEEH